MLAWWLLIIAAALISTILTGALRRYALVHRVMDVPNERSSHSVPTPRGGGMAIVVAFLLFLPLLVGELDIPENSIWPLLGAGAWIALVGFLDDHGHIAAKWRLFAHFLAASWALFWIGGLPPLTAYGMPMDVGWVGYILAVLYLVWMLNLYNFMDGIDGIASIEAICAALSGAFLYILLGDVSLAFVPLLLAGTVAGFLFWNFPPAKIFMGDAGSGFLGIVLGIMSLQAGWVSPELLWSWLILLGAFIVDATLTLFRRLVRGEQIYVAHRSHAYQYAARKYGKHLPVTLAFLIINTTWLFPLAWLVAIHKLNGIWGLVIAYIPLLALAIRFHAGKSENISIE